MPTEEERRQAAIRRLKEKRALLSNVGAYVIVNGFLVVIWALTGAGYFWPIWVMAGWGIGLASHAWAVYGRTGITEEDVEREMRRGGDTIE